MELLSSANCYWQQKSARIDFWRSETRGRSKSVLRSILKEAKAEYAKQ